MRILVVTQYYPPENATIAATLARSLVGRGHEVRVVTGYPNYPEGKLYPGYVQRWRHRERDHGVEVLRVPLWIDHSTSALRRSASYMSFALSAVTARSFAQGADVIYVYATQMTAAFGPWLWRLTGGAPYVLHVQDLWPDSITGSSLVSGKSGVAVHKLLTPWLTSVYRRAEAVIGIAPTMVETLIARGVDSNKVHLVHNWANASPLPSRKGVPRPKQPLAGAKVLYAGNVGDMQALDVAVQAAHQARGSGIELMIVGDGVGLPRIRALVDEIGATNIEFMGRVPRASMARLYAETDFALISLKDLPAFRGTIPSKFQAALAHGVPVITTVQGDLRMLVESLGIGLTAEVEDENDLAEVFRLAAMQTDSNRREMAERARQVYLNEFSQAKAVGQIERVLLAASQHGEE